MDAIPADPARSGDEPDMGQRDVEPNLGQRDAYNHFGRHPERLIDWINRHM